MAHGKSTVVKAISGVHVRPAAAARTALLILYQARRGEARCVQATASWDTPAASALCAPMLMVACRLMTCGESASSSATLSVSKFCTERCGCFDCGALLVEASAEADMGLHESRDLLGSRPRPMDPLSVSPYQRPASIDRSTNVLR